MKKTMLVNVLQPEECRIAIVEDNQLEELYVERTSQNSYVGNIYKGTVVNLEPSIQAAFVDFGVGKNGFLHVSDVEQQYFNHLDPPETAGGRRKDGRPRSERDVRNKPPIQEIFKRGSEVLVQVIKDGIGNKGPTLSTYISIPGRYLVLMPALKRVGVSRKIRDERTRKDLYRVMKELCPPEGLGFIVRTAGVDRSAKDLQRDMNYLLRLWKTIVRRVERLPSPVDVYEESDMITRTIRDIYSTEIGSVLIDDEEQFVRAREFMEVVLPKQVDKVQHYQESEPLFNKYNLESEIDKIQKRTVPLKGGGSIVIDQTEALVAIDVNSGTHRADDNAEENAFQVNLRAAEEISRQIRLRDLGGVVVNDFIDMREEKHRRAVERALKKHVKRDRARTRVLRTSPFGLIEMTRQRIRPSLKRSIYEDCPCCNGMGFVKTAESVSIEVMRSIMTAASLSDKVRKITVIVHHSVGNYLANKKRREITLIEENHSLFINLDVRNDVSPQHAEVYAYDETNNRIDG